MYITLTRYTRKCISKSSNLQRYYTRNSLIMVTTNIQMKMMQPIKGTRFESTAKMEEKFTEMSHLFPESITLKLRIFPLTLRD
ncbi:hypothetical protein V1477_014884 [Vespula maculifrons]|uniref:Uncharacterized protein n=1 Tax=Vespula maculifrons TaxID=7453 RepID=A0ABD2BIP8_VESMC